MTPEEAIRILDPETSAAALYGLGHDEAVALVEDACRLAVAALRQQPKSPCADAAGEEPARNCLHCRSYKPAYICDKQGRTVKDPQQAEPPCVLWEKGEA